MLWENQNVKTYMHWIELELLQIFSFIFTNDFEIVVFESFELKWNILQNIFKRTKDGERLKKFGSEASFPFQFHKPTWFSYIECMAYVNLFISIKIALKFTQLNFFSYIWNVFCSFFSDVIFNFYSNSVRKVFHKRWVISMQLTIGYTFNNDNKTASQMQILDKAYYQITNKLVIA